MKSIKRIAVFFLSIMLMLNILVSAVPVSAESEVSKTYIHDGYTVEYTVTSEWTGYQNIQVSITNTGENIISNWAMGYNAHGEINGLWNAQVYGHQGTEYILKGASYNCEIEPGKSTNFGYTLSGDNFETPQDIINCVQRVDITDGYNVYYNIVADYGDTYQAEMVIENTSAIDISAWQLSFGGNVAINSLWNGKLFENNNGSFKVKNAENNVVIGAGSSVSFNFSGTKNPVTDGTENTIIFNNYKLSGTIIPMQFDFEIEVDTELDSDEDGLPDYIENEIGSDRYNSDTDGDGLPDGYEYFTLGTDPTKIDSDNNGVSDADEDFDDENLSNLEEYNLGTDPFSKDTDYDGLSDYNEVTTYGTDPLKYDTDTDKVSDGDEITLGLDPKNPATNGYPDSEYTTQQTVSEDNSSLDYINTLDGNPYTVSLDIKAAGVADNCLSAGESGYSSSILQNEAVLGVVPEFTYGEGLSVKDVIINFNLDASVAANSSDKPEFQGINRFNVFKYFEDTNMLLPIETFYDEASSKVYTHVDELGTYCLVDMEKWLNYLNALPEGNYYEEDDENTNPPANIVFCLDTRNIIDGESFDEIKTNIKEISQDAFNKYSDIKVYIYYQKFTSDFKVTNCLLKDTKTGNNYFTSYDEAEAALNNLETYLIKCNFWAYDFVEATDYMIKTCDENIIAMYHITADDRVMGSIDDAKELLNTVQNSKRTDDTEKNRIYVSLLCPLSEDEIDSAAYAPKLVNQTNGVLYTKNSSAADENTETETVQESYSMMTVTADSVQNSKSSGGFTGAVRSNLVTILGEGRNNVYKIIYPDSEEGTTLIRLNTVLRSPDKYDAIGITPTDTDNDGLSDWAEVDTKFIFNILKTRQLKDIIEVNQTGNITCDKLPTINECIDYYKDVEYVKNGKEKIMANYKQDYISVLEKTRVLPITSNPTKVDSDGDGMTDGPKLINDAEYTSDEKPLKYSFKYYDEELYPIHLKHMKWDFNFKNYNTTFEHAVDMEYNYCNKWSSPSTVTINTTYAIKPYSNEFYNRISEILAYNSKNRNGISNKSTLIERAFDSYNTLITKEGVEYYLNPKSYLTEDDIYSFLKLDLHSEIVNRALISDMLTNTYFDTGICNTTKEDFVNFFNDMGVDVDPYYIFVKTKEENGTGAYYKDTNQYSDYINGSIGKYVYGGMNANNGSAYTDTVNLSPDDWTTPLKVLLILLSKNT